MTRLAPLLVILGLAFPACDARRVSSSPSDDAGPVAPASADAGQGVDSRPRGRPSTPTAPPPPPTVQCLVAVRVDNCCTTPEPATAEAVAADPCLKRYPTYTVPAACADQWPEECALIDCTYGVAPSRLAEPDGAGGCAFVSECQTVDDCVVVGDSSQCCSCPRVVPRSMADEDPCLVIEGDKPPEGCAPAACDAVECEACSSPDAPVCVPSDSDGLSRCEAGAWG